jgi:CubicO group peptidase (beta-lactamase class C family)
LVGDQQLQADCHQPFNVRQTPVNALRLLASNTHHQAIDPDFRIFLHSIDRHSGGWRNDRFEVLPALAPSFLKRRIEAAKHVIGFAHGKGLPIPTGWFYSNTNNILVAEIIEAASGKSYRQELEELLLKPLHLHDEQPAGRWRQPVAADRDQAISGAAEKWPGSEKRLIGLL